MGLHGASHVSQGSHFQDILDPEERPCEEPTAPHENEEQNTERSTKSTKESRCARDDSQHNAAVQRSNTARMRVRLKESKKGTQVKVNMTESDKERSTRRWCKQRLRRRTRMRIWRNNRQEKPERGLMWFAKPT